VSEIQVDVFFISSSSKQGFHFLYARTTAEWDSFLGVEGIFRKCALMPGICFVFGVLQYGLLYWHIAVDFCQLHKEKKKDPETKVRKI